jgi:roadblock/LC7 domain-containing protein
MIYSIIDSHLVSDTEVAQKDIARQLSLRNANELGERIMLNSGAHLDFTAPAPAAPLFVKDDGVTPLAPIGFGLPMTVDIRHVYSGNVGVRNIDGTGDIAVMSSVKDWSVFKAAGRALNFVAIHNGKHSNLTGPGALTDGTRVIAYQKAVVAKQVLLTVELTAAGKQDGILSQLGSAFTAAAGVPLFMPYAGALLAAGQIVPIVGKLADAISGSHSPWSLPAEINFGLPGTQPSVAEFKLLASAAADFTGYTFVAGRGLVDAQGAVYSGDEPYVVVAIYGDLDSDLEGFTPAIAGADLMKRFYEAQSGSGAVLSDLVDLMKVASDVKFRDQAMALKTQIDAAPANSDTTELKKKYDAAVANIDNPALRPPAA